ncbi:hypothetical protein LOTGIDRAFT_112980 [Lottia gigantea]|uniref:Sulfatase N-terminal domain-containing protein n=1 Tax=Lottia gigantea TaxID=225164 RepID=V4CDI5_LOTGI|nr:hypothetical protein LOTGIDRAFT_112980 [Lottia gigantea]ESO99974.1 hypothetical protein LOTGIDRAFT_112980 [Lottia gigantea]
MYLLTLSESKPPNIVFIVADDLGWNDVGYHNPEIKTPNIDKLAREGVILNQSYVQPLCSPSRSSFMSGYYPFRTGLQHLVIISFQPVCLPLNISTLPQELKKLGYATHMIGKWHLGFCKWECTPTYRGFDSFFGYYNADEDYYNHSLSRVPFKGYFLDYRDDRQPVRDQDGVYSTHAFTKRAESVISQHDTSKPLFLYLPYQAVHEPIEVPKQYENMYPNIQSEGRRKFSGMVSALDEGIGNVTAALKQKGIYDDTIILFTADNGGWVSYYGNNYPLRGGKFTIYEGGTRGAAFIRGTGITGNRTYDELIHAVDWLPTLVSAAGGSVTGRDGQDLWKSISTGSGENRTEFIYNIDDDFPPVEGHAGIRYYFFIFFIIPMLPVLMGDYKLIEGYPGLFPDWYKPDTEMSSLDDPVEEFMAREGYKADNGYQLFNIKEDPTEHNDLSTKNPEIVAKLKARLEYYRKTFYVKPNFPILPDFAADPTKFNNTWSPGWC